MTLCGYSAFILRESQLKQKTKKKQILNYMYTIMFMTSTNVITDFWNEYPLENVTIFLFEIVFKRLTHFSKVFWTSVASCCPIKILCELWIQLFITVSLNKMHETFWVINEVQSHLKIIKMFFCKLPHTVLSISFRNTSKVFSSSECVLNQIQVWRT